MLPCIILDSQLPYPSGRAKWVCHDNYFLWGHGATPEAAYFDWRIKSESRTRHKRAGCWAKIPCHRWAQQGMKPLRTYIGGKHIVAYDWATDELILRG